MKYKDSIKIMRKKALLSQEEFASELGVAFTTVNRWENGKCEPNYKALKKLAEFCKLHNLDAEIFDFLEGGM